MNEEALRELRIILMRRVPPLAADEPDKIIIELKNALEDLEQQQPFASVEPRRLSLSSSSKQSSKPSSRTG